MLQNEETLRKLEGLQTLDLIMQKLDIKRQTAKNLVTKWKKQQHLTVWKKGSPRIYKITMRKQRPRKEGMFDILNKYSPMKLAPWYDHQVHGKYTVENAIVDAIQTESFRAILATLRLFNHVTDWPRLYGLAKKHDCWQKVGALYDVARLHFRVRRMSEIYQHPKFRKKINLIKDYDRKEERYIPIETKWKVAVSFRKGDIWKVKYDYA
jgi:hypothetical protein